MGKKVRYLPYALRGVFKRNFAIEVNWETLEEASNGETFQAAALRQMRINPEHKFLEQKIWVQRLQSYL